MRVIHDFGEFYKLVKPLRFDDFDGLDIIPSTELGVFFPNRLSALLMFCKHTPQYHIISHLECGVELNKPVDGGYSYELGQGDNDPELIYIENITWLAYEKLKILKFKFDKF